MVRSTKWWVFGNEEKIERIETEEGMETQRKQWNGLKRKPFNDVKFRLVCPSFSLHTHTRPPPAWRPNLNWLDVIYYNKWNWLNPITKQSVLWAGVVVWVFEAFHQHFIDCNSHINILFEEICTQKKNGWWCASWKHFCLFVCKWNELGRLITIKTLLSNQNTHHRSTFLHKYI